MRKSIIVDIDGTVADATHRLPLILANGRNHFKKDWDGFFAACVNDEPIFPIIELVRTCSLLATVIYVSGRSDSVRLETRSWLTRHGLPFGSLHMRKHGDHRPDYQVKAEIMDTEIKLEPKDVWFILDDRDQVVRMWRERGYRVLQVAEGDF